MVDKEQPPGILPENTVNFVEMARSRVTKAETAVQEAEERPGTRQPTLLWQLEDVRVITYDRCRWTNGHRTPSPDDNHIERIDRMRSRQHATCDHTTIALPGLVADAGGSRGKWGT